MDAIPYSSVRKHLVETMERVCDDHEPVIITRQNSRSVVLLSLDDYNAIEETAYLLRSPANAANLRKSIQQYEQGKYKRKGLIEE
jgi:antitoxin YefM